MDSAMSSPDQTRPPSPKRHAESDKSNESFNKSNVASTLSPSVFFWQQRRTEFSSFRRPSICRSHRHVAGVEGSLQDARLRAGRPCRPPSLLTRLCLVSGLYSTVNGSLSLQSLDRRPKAPTYVTTVGGSLKANEDVQWGDLRRHERRASARVRNYSTNKQPGWSSTLLLLPHAVVFKQHAAGAPWPDSSFIAILVTPNGTLSRQSIYCNVALLG